MTVKNRIFTVLLLALFSLTLSCSLHADNHVDDTAYDIVKQRIVTTYQDVVPQQWGETVTGVKTHLATQDKIIALTFDACGSQHGMQHDTKITDFLIKEQIPATLFINARWIEPNMAAFQSLSANPLFEIGNHGYQHRPASVNGRSVYGITGTNSVAALVDEIELNARKVEALTGKRPLFYRSGTAYYDEVAVQIAQELGSEVAGFSVLGDAGATYSRQQVKQALLSATAGDIVILHMNHPESGTAEGLIDAIPELKRRGFRFVQLSDIPLL
ncbi:MAG: polysaccharide deacetylase family protein [Deltaproteobacteria bacterium]|nr:polysaccharide deacetylase family protein [Deltaproteobacteria bacterium]